MQLDQLYLDEVLFDIYPVSGIISGTVLPPLHNEGSQMGLFYFKNNDGTTTYAKQHEIYVCNNQKYMVLDGEWFRIV